MAAIIKRKNRYCVVYKYTAENGERKQEWAISTYTSNIGIINNYILPFIGDTKLSDLTSRVLEKFYQQLLKTKAVPRTNCPHPKNELVSTGTVRDVHKLLRNCLRQAVKWDLMEKNPVVNATNPW